MKTRNKIRMSVLAAIVACVLMLLNSSVHAQFSRSIIGAKETTLMAMALETGTNDYVEKAIHSSKTEIFNAFSVYLAEETEETLLLEDWMLDESSFEFESNDGQNIKIEDNKENQNNPYTISTATFFYSEVNIEEKLEIESWMVNPKIWKH